MKKEDLWAIGLIVLTPIFYYLINQDWPFPPVNYHDSYYNFPLGFFFNELETFAIQYKSERVSWLIPFYFLLKIFDGHSFVLIWSICAYWLTGGLFYFLIKELHGQKRALLTLPIFLCYPQLVGEHSGGAAYHNYATNLYFMSGALFWVTGLSHENYSKLSVVVSGAFIGSSIISNILMIPLLILIVPLQYLKNNRCYWRPYLFLALGLLISYLFWSLFSLSLGHGWVSFLERIKVLLAHTEPHNFVNSWHRPIESFFFLNHTKTEYLGMHFVFYFSGLLFLIKNHRSKNSSNIFLFTCLVPIVFWFTCHALGLQSLAPADFTYPLIIPLFLGLPVLLSVDSWSLKNMVSLYCGLFLMSTTLGSFSEPVLYQFINNKVLSLVFILFMGVSLGFLGHKKYGLVTFLIFLSLFYGHYSDPYKSITNPKCRVNKEMDAYVHRLFDKLQNLGVERQKVNLFFSKEKSMVTNLKGCHQVSFKIGMLHQYVHYLLGGFHFLDFKRNFAFMNDGHKFIDKHFFKRMADQGVQFVVTGVDMSQDLNLLITAADKQGYQLVRDSGFSSPLLGQKIQGLIFKVRPQENL